MRRTIDFCKYPLLKKKQRKEKEKNKRRESKKRIPKQQNLRMNKRDRMKMKEKGEKDKLASCIFLLTKINKGIIISLTKNSFFNVFLLFSSHSEEIDHTLFFMTITIRKSRKCNLRSFCSKSGSSFWKT